MSSSAERLRARGRAIGAAKAESHAEATAAHLALDLGARLLAAVELSDANAGEWSHQSDDEAETWRRVNRRLAALR